MGWFDMDAPKVTIQPNPMVKAVGPGPAGKRCKTCKHLIALAYANTYYKCGKGKVTHSSATDHRVNWPACSMYEEE